MKEYILKTNNLTKKYQGICAIQNVSLTLEAGKVYALIGRNGAGKTTLMRLISGLSFPSEGSIELFGKSSDEKLLVERKRLGCMIEYPSFIPYMSAKDNLTYYRIVRGIPSTTIVDELLEMVGLNNTGKKKVKNFSLGMKQRLGIAIAMLGNPELLILDEPTNGLDPVGVIEIRNLITKLCEERHITVLISSHNLPELYQVATNYIFINQGELIQSITLEELEEKCKRHILIACDQPEKLTSILETQLNTTNYKVLPDKTIKLYDYINEKEKVTKTIFENGVIITSFSIEGDTLEEYFITMIGGGEND